MKLFVIEAMRNTCRASTGCLGRHFAEARDANVNELAVDDDAPGRAGDVLSDREIAECLVDARKRRLQRLTTVGDLGLAPGRGPRSSARIATMVRLAFIRRPHRSYFLALEAQPDLRNLRKADLARCNGRQPTARADQCA